MAVALIGPDGRQYHVEEADLKGALEAGYRVDNGGTTLGEDLKGLGNDALESADVAVSSGFKGATAGLSDVATGLLGEKDTREAIKAQREKHPIASGAGELAGMLASPVGDVGAALEVPALGKVGAKIAGGVGVGSLFGAGDTLSDQILGDQQLSAEKIVAGAGLGALLGGAGGLLGHVVDSAAEKVLPKLGESIGGAQDSLNEFANVRALKAAGALKKDMQYLGPERAQLVGKAMMERGHLGNGLQAPNAPEILESISKDKEGVGAEIGKAYEALEAAGAKPDYAALQQKLADFEQSLSPLQRKAAQSSINEASQALHEYSGKALDKDGASIQLKEPEGFTKLKEFKSDLQGKAKWSNNIADQFGGDLKRQLSGVMRDALDQQIIPHLGADAGKAFTDARNTYGLLADAERVAEHGVEKLGNASFGLRDTGLGVGFIAHGNPVTGLAAALGSKFMRDRGQAVVARLAKSIADSQALSAIASSFSKALPLVAPRLGEYAPQLMSALGRSPAEALAMHMTMAGADSNYQDAAAAAGLKPEPPDQHAASLAKAHGLASMAATLDAHNKDLDAAIEGAIRGGASSAHTPERQDFGAKRMRQEKADAHQTRVDEAMALANDPNALLDRVTANVGNLAHIAPGVTAQLSAVAARAVKYLAHEGLVPPPAGPLAPKWRHSDAEMHEYAQAHEAITAPMSVLKHAKAGTLTPQRVKAFQAVYPVLAREVSDRIVQEVAAKKDVPYRQRLMLSMLTGMSLDGSDSGMAIARNQAAIHAQEARPSLQKPQDSKLTLGERTATPEERREQKDRA